MSLLSTLKEIAKDRWTMQIDSYPQEGIFCETTCPLEAHEAVREVELAVVTVADGWMLVSGFYKEDWLVDKSEGFPYGP